MLTLIAALFAAILQHPALTQEVFAMNLALERLARGPDATEGKMEYDLPCYKVLANNDTSGAKGHQGGIVIPKDIAVYFPQLPEDVSEARPTVDTDISAELWLESTFIGKVVTRYQHQTWGGKRHAERRLTANLGPLRDLSSEGDIMLFQRSLYDPNAMKLTLVRKGSVDFKEIDRETSRARWGTLFRKPATNEDLDQAEKEVANLSVAPFELFVDEVERTTTSVRKIARARAFRIAVLSNFDSRCLFTDRQMFDTSGATGIDAAHIVPLGCKGTNDVRNGLALSKEVHWAFDAGLLSVKDNQIVVSDRTHSDRRNAYLISFSGRHLPAMKTAKLAPSGEALNWHFENVFVRGAA